MSRFPWIPTAAVIVVTAACGGTDSSNETVPPADAAAEDAQVAEASVEAEAAVQDSAPEASPEAEPEPVPEAGPEPVPEAGPDHVDEDVVAPEADAPVVVPGCGNGVREPDEECDDGLATLAALRSCDSKCVVIDHLGEPDPESKQREPGTGRHPIAIGPLGYAVAAIEWADDPRINVSTFDGSGQHSGFTHVEGTTEGAGPGVARLPDGSFALAYAAMGVDGDGLGIALVRVPAAGGAAGPTMVANQNTAFSQHSPDLIALQDGVVVGWQDDKSGFSSTVCHRRFNAQLSPAGGAVCEPFDSTARSNLALGVIGDSLVRAWLEVAGIRVSIEGGASALLPFDGLGADELPAIAALDSAHVLAVYTDTGGAQRAAVLHKQQGLIPAGISTLNPSAPERRNPALAATSDGVYLAWWEPTGPLVDASWDPKYEELYLQKLSWDGTTLGAVALPVPLPRRQSHRLGDQRTPALAGDGALLLAAWYDQTNDNYVGEASHGDVAIELIPTPMLRKQGVE